METRQRLYRREAIVLRERDYGEADRVLTLLTSKGKVTAMAHGVRRPTSRKVGHLQLLSRVEVLLARGRNMDVITQAETVATLEPLRADLMRFTLACYLAELVDQFAQEDDETRELYDLLVWGLNWLAADEDPLLGVRFFELRLLSYAGYQPQLYECVGCGTEIVPAANALSAEFGGLLCPHCAPIDGRARVVSIAAQKVLRFIQRATGQALERLRLRPATHAEVERLLHDYLEYVLERELKSAVFLRRLRRDLEQASRQ